MLIIPLKVAIQEHRGDAKQLELHVHMTGNTFYPLLIQAEVIAGMVFADCLLYSRYAEPPPPPRAVSEKAPSR